MIEDLNFPVELEVLPACESYGLGVIPWSPLSSGMLAGALKKAAEGRRAEGGVQNMIAANRDSLERYEALCAEIGEQPADVALAWLLANPVVTGPIIGPRTIEQLDGSLRSLEIKLSPETMTKLDKIWPGPGGPGPEAWAW